jgi:hypothetical protein
MRLRMSITGRKKRGMCELILFPSRDPLKATLAMQGEPRKPEIRTQKFSEPWELAEDGTVTTSSGDIVHLKCGDSAEYTALFAEAGYMRRIVACVNACEGLESDKIERSAGVCLPVSNGSRRRRPKGRRSQMRRGYSRLR